MQFLCLLLTFFLTFRFSLLKGQEKVLKREQENFEKLNKKNSGGNGRAVEIKNLPQNSQKMDVYSKVTFTPTKADRLVLAFRKWLRKVGNGGVKWVYGAQNGSESGEKSRREVIFLYFKLIWFLVKYHYFFYVK